MILSQKDFASKSNPAKFFNCEPIIINDVADVKALVTGTEMKSTIKPTNAHTHTQKRNKLVQFVRKIYGNPNRNTVAFVIGML